MDDLLRLFDNLVKQSVQKFNESQPSPDFSRWKYCAALLRCGWEAYDYATVPDQHRDDIVVKWRKEGKDEIHVKLSFTEQRLWFRYLEQQGEKNDATK